MMSTPKPPVVASATNASASLLDSGKYSDLVLVCEGHEFKVHRAIVCPHSDVLQAACDGPFLESKGKIEISAPTASVASVARMLSYLYKQQYDDATNSMGGCGTEKTPKDQGPSSTPGQVSDSVHTGEDDALSTIKLRDALPALSPSADVLENLETAKSKAIRNIHVYGLGKYYMIEKLKDVARMKFGLAFRELEALQLDNKTIDEDVLNIIVEIVEEAYKHTEDGDALRAELIRDTTNNHRYLSADKQFLHDVQHIGEFMSDFMTSVVQSYESKSVEDTSQWKNTLQDLTTKISDYQYPIIHKKVDVSILEDERNLLKQFVNDLCSLSGPCRHCGNSGTAKKDRKGNGKLFARCSISGCNTKF